jgi:hypothetical protein
LLVLLVKVPTEDTETDQFCKILEDQFDVLLVKRATVELARDQF